MLRTYITVRAVFWILQGIVLLIMLAGAFVAHGQVVTGDLLDVRHGQIVRDAVNRPAAVLDVLNALSARPSQPSATVVKFDEGGRISEYDARWRVIAAAGGPVEVRGICQSACTMVVIHIPRPRLCFGEFSSLGFHQARYDDGSLAPTSTKWMIDKYPADIQAWIAAKGGLEAMPQGNRYWTLPAAKLWEMGYRKCD